MDIFEQVGKVLKDIEAREYQRWKERRLEEGMLLTDLIARYNRHVALRQWEPANECLSNISRLVVAMLAE